VTYPNPDGSDYNRGSGSSSKNTTSDYGAAGPDESRIYGGADKWTQGLLDKLNDGEQITTKRTE
jgi:hypothetical protein